MFNFECCGVSNYSDFSQTDHNWKLNDTLIITPRACCKFKNRYNDWSGIIPNFTRENGLIDCNKKPDNTNNNFYTVLFDFNLLFINFNLKYFYFFLKGCYEKINDIFTSYRLILLTITIGIGLVLVSIFRINLKIINCLFNGCKRFHGRFNPKI